MARPHKQMSGSTFHINYHEDGSATIECSYFCPYCQQDTTSSFEINASSTNEVENGVFFEPLHCSSCDKITDVIFTHDCKI